MEEKKYFTTENEKEEFKGLCVAVLPQIKEIMRVMKEKGVEATSSISTGADGYINFHIYGSRWEMMRYGGEGAVTIRYGYSEEIDDLDNQEIGYSKVAENLMEISMVFANMQKMHEELSDIYSVTWKQQFVKWANEFEKMWSENDGEKDYLEEIEKFAEMKIKEYAGLEK